jgi:Bacterial type III secretion protein (HrpB1_HrpK)
MTSQPHTLPRELTHMFCDVLSIADKGDDGSALVNLLRFLRPNDPGLIIAQAVQKLSKSDHLAARALIEDAERQFGDKADFKALMAVCLYLQSDPLWHSYANEVRDMPDNADALQFIEYIEPARAAA